jgi:2-dehydropantoate 2-reductase
VRVCVYGLGAMGGLIAARLAAAGVEVTAVARGATLAAVRRDGLTLVEPAPTVEGPGAADPAGAAAAGTGVTADAVAGAVDGVPRVPSVPRIPGVPGVPAVPGVPGVVTAADTTAAGASLAAGTRATTTTATTTTATTTTATTTTATAEAADADGARAAVVGNVGDEVTRVHIPVSDRPAELGEHDLVIVAVKATALGSVAEGVGPLLGPDTCVLSAMNGIPWWFFAGLVPELRGIRLASVDPRGALAAALPASRVVGAVLHLSASVPEPGRIQGGAGNRIIIGEATGGPSARLDAVAALLARGDFTIETSPLIQRDVWFKLWGNMTMNPISSLTGATLDRILDDPGVRALASAMMTEAAAVGDRLGLPIDQDPEERHAVTRRIGAARTSMLQDVEAGRPIELDALVTAVTEIARRFAVPTPMIDAVLALTRLHAQVRGLYPRTPPTS